MNNYYYNNRPLSAYLYRGKNGKFNYVSIMVTLMFTIMVPGLSFVLGILAAAGLEMVIGGQVVSSVFPADTTVDTTATRVPNKRKTKWQRLARKLPPNDNQIFSPDDLK